RWSETHGTISISLGEEYLRVLSTDALSAKGKEVRVFPGSIGRKLQQINGFLGGFSNIPRRRVEAPQRRISYFLPDWDDFLDRHFDFGLDRFSSDVRASRQEIHCCE